MADSLRRVKRRSRALLEIAERQHPRAQLRQPARFGQRAPAHLFRRLFCGAGLDLAPVVLAAPLAVGPMLHLIDALRLHRRESPTPKNGACAYRRFLATIGPAAIIAVKFG